MSAFAERSGREKVKPYLVRAVMKPTPAPANKEHRVYLNFSNRWMRTHLSGGVGGESR